MLILPLFFACTSPLDSGDSSPHDTDTDADSDSDTDTDTDTDTDADSDTDTDTDSDTDTDTGPACGRYHATHLVGATGVYGYTAYATSQLGYDGTTVNVTESFNEGSGLGVISSTTDVSGSAYRYYRSTSETTYECDNDGLWYRGSTLSWQYETSTGYTDTGTMVYTYDDGYLILPANLAVGSTWSVSGSGSYTGDYSGSFTYDVSSEALATESVTVPAGTYVTLKVRQNSGTSSDYWVAEDIGTIKSDYLELESWE